MVLAAAVSFAFGGVVMKYADGLRNPQPTMVVFILFMLGAALQIVAMRDTELSVTYLVVLGLEAVLSFALGLLVFKESMYVDCDVVGQPSGVESARANQP